MGEFEGGVYGLVGEWVEDRVVVVRPLVWEKRGVAVVLGEG